MHAETRGMVARRRSNCGKALKRAAAATALVGALFVFAPAPASAQATLASAPAEVIPSIESLTPAKVWYDAEHELLNVELPPTNLAAATPQMEGMVSSPIYRAVMPVSCTAYSAQAEILDGDGQRLPQTFLHHFDLTDPDHRDLFLPFALHVLALSKETPPMVLPRFVFGLPIAQGQRLIAWDMLHNATQTAHQGVRARLEFGCRPTGTGWFGSLFPFVRGFPMTLDVLAAQGRRAYSLKSFDLPPGRSSKSIDGSPSIPGTIVGLGGHLHDYGVALDFTDVTTGEVLWHVVPQRDSAGHVLNIPITMFYNWHRLGLHITPDHRYRVTASYDNPTGHVILAGGMGVIGGLFVPDHPEAWPAVDRTNDAYVQDMIESFGIGAPPDMSGMRMAGH